MAREYFFIVVLNLYLRMNGEWKREGAGERTHPLVAPEMPPSGQGWNQQTQVLAPDQVLNLDHLVHRPAL